MGMTARSHIAILWPMSGLTERTIAPCGRDPDRGAVPAAASGNWKPLLTLLLLSPTIGELLSGSSPPLLFFNPISLLFQVGLYGCGALLVRETVARRRLNVIGLLLLGAAYGIVEEGITCKSFFNPNWTDTGFSSVYGRAWGVSWVWTFGLTAYHMVVSITAPIFLTEALFSARAQGPWLRRRGWITASTSLSLVAILGFVAFDNRQFHLTEVKQPLALAHELNAPTNSLARFISTRLNTKNRELVRQAVVTQVDSPELRHALQEELNRLLPRPELYSSDHFAGVTLTPELRQQAATRPRGDPLITFNRALLERAFPEILAARAVYPFRPGWFLTLSSLAIIAGLVTLSLKQTQPPPRTIALRKPWLTGLGFTAAFFVIGFALPSLVEHGTRIPAVAVCGLWCVVVVILARALRTMDGAEDRVWRRGLWAIGVITPCVFFALLLGVFVGII